MPPTSRDTSTMEWRPFEDASGVSYKVLRHHAGRHGITLLLRFDPGATYPSHRHPQGEEVFVLEGSYEDGGQRYGAGCFLFHEPGSVHRPRSREGCVLLVTLPAHIETVPDPS